MTTDSCTRFSRNVRKGKVDISNKKNNPKAKIWNLDYNLGAR